MEEKEEEMKNLHEDLEVAKRALRDVRERERESGRERERERKERMVKGEVKGSLKFLLFPLLNVV